MAAGDVFLTQEGYDKLTGELEFLTNVKRKELSKEIGEARAKGDISENAEYDAAKEAQGLCEKRIAEISGQLSRARIIENENLSADEVLIGATVRLKDMNNSEEIEYILVSEAESDFSKGKISVTSPIGSGLIGHKKGDVVDITVPAGVLRYKILDISRK